MSAWHLFLLVIGLTAVSFGGGNMLLAGLERELVRPGIVSPADFAAGVALGQATPGPLAAFTTAIGRYVDGVPGALAATLALVVVSLCAVVLISRVPRTWFQKQAVRGALASMGPYALALVLFLALRVVSAGSISRPVAPVGIAVAVFAGRLRKWPTAPLLIGAVLAGMLLQGTALAGW